VSDGPEWFAPKRYGLGSGRPITWQGWVVAVSFVAIVIVISLLFHNDKVRLVAALILPSVVFMVVTAKTTRGGWRWRWGEED
jgi:hypothetical protein